VSGTVTFDDGGAALAEANRTLTQTLQSISESTGQSFTQALATVGDSVKDALSQGSTMADTKATDGTTGAGKTLLWLVLGGLNLLRGRIKA
jgi:hypothetical protein